MILETWILSFDVAVAVKAITFTLGSNKRFNSFTLNNKFQNVSPLCTDNVEN